VVSVSETAIENVLFPKPYLAKTIILMHYDNFAPPSINLFLAESHKIHVVLLYPSVNKFYLKIAGIQRKLESSTRG
jgi:hypothetical protein